MPWVTPTNFTDGETLTATRLNELANAVRFLNGVGGAPAVGENSWYETVGAGGGTLDVGAEEADGATEIVVKMEGDSIVLDPELRRMLVDGEAANGVTARNAAAYITHRLVRDAGGRILVSEPAPNVMILGAAVRSR